MTRPMPRSATEVAELFPELAPATPVIVYTDWSRDQAVRTVATVGTVARHARGGYVTVREAHGTTCDYDPRDIVPGTASSVAEAAALTFLHYAVAEWERLNDQVESPISVGIAPEPALQRQWDDAAHEVAAAARTFLASQARTEAVQA
jgi:hypothetical protein